METIGTLELQKSKLEDILILIEHLENITRKIARKSYRIFLYDSASFGSVSIYWQYTGIYLSVQESLGTHFHSYEMKPFVFGNWSASCYYLRIF